MYDEYAAEQERIKKEEADKVGSQSELLLQEVCTSLAAP